jgi:hypothetical protein
MSGESSVTLPDNTTLGLEADGTLNYGATPSATVDLLITQWQHPFGISFLVIDQFGFGVTLNEEGMDIEAGGTFTIGQAPNQIDVELILAVEDFEIPSGLVFTATADTAGTEITLPNLVGAFVPSLGTAIAQLPFASDFGFTNLTVVVVEAPFSFGGHSYAAGFGATGDITFFSWTLDFAFQVSTSGVSASGSINNPIVVNAGGVNILTLSDTTGTKGPSGSIDTMASPYFTLNASLALLGLINASVDAYVGDDNFTFDATLSVFDVANAQLSCTLDPNTLAFSGAASVSAHLPSLSLPSLTIAGVEILPSIPLTPDIAASIGLTISSNPPSFGFSLSFEVAGMSVSVNPTFDLSAVETALSDFGTFLKNWMVNNVEALFGDILNVAKDLAQFLYNLGQSAEQAIAALAQQFGGDVTAIVNDVWTAVSGCAVTAANDVLGGGSDIEAADTSTALVALTHSATGQTLLEHYYLHAPEIQRLMATTPAIRTTLQAIQSQHDAGAPALTLIKAAVTELQKVGSPGLAASARAVLPTLEPHQNQTWGQFVNAINTPTAHP